MKKIKIIDLLNMRARNEEMPRKIKYDATEFQYNGEYGMYYDENFDSLEDIIFLFKRFQLGFYTVLMFYICNCKYIFIINI